MNRVLAAAMVAGAVMAGGAQAAEPVPNADAIRELTKDDPFIWLEEVEGEKALDWVRARNAQSLDVLKTDPRYEEFFGKALAILEAKDRIPVGSLRGGRVFNFWQDETNVRGLWRVTTLASYETASPQWDVLLDVDALAKAENENWVFQGANCLPPEHRRCLISLSRGGKDANVVREFDAQTKTFVDGGFVLTEAKQQADWVDENTLLVGSDYGPGTMTTSGYPRQVKLWSRGTPLSAARLVFEGEDGDVGVWPAVAHRPEGAVVMVSRAPSFFESEIVHVAPGGGTVTKLPLPRDIEPKGLIDGQVLFSIRKAFAAKDAAGAEIALPQGALASAPLANLLKDSAVAGAEILFAPNERQSIEDVGTTKDAVVVTVLDNVIGKAIAFRRESGRWTQAALDLPGNGSVDLVSADDFSDGAFFLFRNFVTPDRLIAVGTPGRNGVIKTLPARFDAAGLEVRQEMAASKDGTQVPYFVVRKAGAAADGSTPTLLYGYGGFEISQAPWYWASAGRLWLERGGAVAVANIRGGGEFGPRWHQAALRENRQRAFDDFIAVAEDLQAKKITSPGKLGIMGGSNGGLLVGAVAVQRPELFKAVVCQVPLLDMIRYTLLPPGASWIAEYGDPGDPGMRAAIAAYSPYQNLTADGTYPKIFFMTSTKDDRVHPGHARKMAAAMEKNGQPFLYYENIEGGHSAAANLRQRAEQQALAFVYLSRMLMD